MIKIFAEFDELNDFAAELFVARAKDAIENRGRFTVALSGGSTPKALYKLLTTEKFTAEIHWKNVYFFFGDERNVLPDEEESNFLMAHESLFEPLKIAADRIFRWHTEIEPPENIAADYAAQIENFFGETSPRFDLILLGMGDDGHTASLFPHTRALAETDALCVANYVEKLNTTRLTFTYPLINNARCACFLVKGADKNPVLKEVLEGVPQPEKYPSQAVKLTDGDLFWLVDAAAAESLAR